MDRLATADNDRWEAYEAFIRDHWVKTKAATLPPGSRVLDAGAGASKYRPYFAHCRYETQDFCKYEGPLVQYVEPINHVCEITAIPLPDQSLDAIICTEVIEHVVDPMAVLQEFARLLKPGGQLFLSAPLLSHLHMEPYHYYGGFTKYWYHHWLPARGLVVEEIRPVGGPGRTSVVYLQTWYGVWTAAEQRLTPGKRLVSKTLRAVAAIPVRLLLPRLLPRMDAWLGTALVCSGYLVTAKRAATSLDQPRP